MYQKQLLGTQRYRRRIRYLAREPGELIDANRSSSSHEIIVAWPFVSNLICGSWLESVYPVTGSDWNLNGSTKRGTGGPWHRVRLVNASIVKSISSLSSISRLFISRESSIQSDSKKFDNRNFLYRVKKLIKYLWKRVIRGQLFRNWDKLSTLEFICL